MSNECTDESIGSSLELLKYSFRKSSPESQKSYKQHLKECQWCSGKSVKVNLKMRLKGVLNILGGIALIFFSMFVPFAGWIMLIGGIVWSGIGLWRLISGRD